MDHAVQEFLFKEFDDFAGQVLFRLEMAVAGTSSESCIFSDFSHRTAFIAFFYEKLHRCVEESFRRIYLLFIDHNKMMNVHLVKYERSFIKYKKNCQGINLLTVILSNTFCPGLNRSRETMIH